MVQTEAYAPLLAKDTSPEILTVSHLYKSFGEKKILIDFNLSLHQGENLVVLGKSGVGKSVLIKCIIGLLDQDQGTINLLGKDLSQLRAQEKDQLRARVGFLFQSNALYDSMTIRENLEFPLRRHWVQVTEEETNRLVMDVLTDVGLAHTVDMMPAELSGGMRKRIALARTLIMKPAIILYDEPTTGLDPVTGKEIIELIIDIRKKYQTASLIISHDMTCVRLAADRIIVLVDGRCYAEGSYGELLRSDDPNIKQFFQF